MKFTMDEFGRIKNLNTGETTIIDNAMKFTMDEFGRIKNLNTGETTIIDKEGNIEHFGGDLDDDLGGKMPDLFPDDNEFSYGIRPDGSSDGLDGLEFGLEDDDNSELDFDFNSQPEMDGQEGMGEEDLPQDDIESIPNDEELDTDTTFPEDEEADESDPNFQGVIRTVTGACLVYKRKDEDGTYEELWIHNVGKNMRNEVRVRRSILAGTDIPPQQVSSEDGTQKVETNTIGNVQFIRITGLPN